MNSKVKRALMRVGGFVTYVGLPIIPTALQWDFLMHTDAKTTISSSVMLVLICSLPVLKYIFKSDKLPADVNKVWAVVLICAVVFKYIADQVIWVSAAGVGGSLVGSYLFKTADNQLAEEKTIALQTKAIQQANASQTT